MELSRIKDFNYEILGVHLSHLFEAIYNKAYEEGLTEIPYDDGLLTKQFARELLYWNGKEWTPEPAMANRWK